MKPAPFVYHRPGSVAEAAQLLEGGDAKVLAGGQSLVPLMSMRLVSPAALVDINHVPDLDTIEVDDEVVRIGALVRHRALETYDGTRGPANDLLSQALSHVAHPTIRNRGTTVGSLVHADPAAEMPAVLCLLDGSIEALSAARGRRTVDAADLFLGPMECALGSDEVAVTATFRHPPARSGTAWLEVSRRHGDYAVVGVGAVVTIDESGQLVGGRLGYVGVGPAPVVLDVTPAIAGRDAGSLSLLDADLSAVDELVSQAVSPEADIHASAEYRAQLARTLGRRSVIAAVQQSVRVFGHDPAPARRPRHRGRA